jgi:hypothetical protein
VREHNIPEEWRSDNKLPAGMCPVILNSLISVQLPFYISIATLTFIAKDEMPKKYSGIWCNRTIHTTFFTC